jgi:hypothetical protein
MADENDKPRLSLRTTVWILGLLIAAFLAGWRTLVHLDTRYTPIPATLPKGYRCAVK